MACEVLVFGGGGMLGSDVIRAGESLGLAVRGIDRAEADVTNLESVRAAIRAHAPEAIMNCAAYTKVDQAEQEEALALSINGDGARNVARAAAEAGARLLHVSTDYVFDGRKSTPYLESDPIAPISAYGRTKAAGETHVLTEHPRAIVARTSWLFGNSGKNFVTTMLSLARQGRELNVISDQIGAPTYTGHLSTLLLRLLQTNHHGIFHTTASGSCSWHDFAAKIFLRAGVHPAALRPIPTSAYPTPATRPANSRLADTRLLALGLPPLPAWELGLADYLAEIRELANPPELYTGLETD